MLKSPISLWLGQQMCKRILIPINRNSTLFSTDGRKKNYYEILGVPRTATHQEIKTAYYKLSKIHHPDMSKNVDKQFLEVTEAYNVLGNSNLRHRYDKGMLDESVIHREPPVDAPPIEYEAFYRSRQTRNRTSSAHAHDLWSSKLYSDMVAEQSLMKQKQIIRGEREKKEEFDSKLEHYLGLIILLSALAFVVHARPKETEVPPKETEVPPKETEVPPKKDSKTDK